MQREGGLAKMEAEYGYPCRNQEEFAVRHMLTLQLHDPMLIAVTSQASCKCLSVLNLGLWVVHMLHNVLIPPILISEVQPKDTQLLLTYVDVLAII